MSTSVVDARELTVELGGRAVLRDVDLRVDAGEVVTLLGANGSGKSTLVRAVVGLLPVASGEISMFGQPLGSFHDWKRIGYVPQRTTASGGVPATVREVVMSGRLARRRPFRSASRADRAAVERAIDMVSLSDRADDGVASLSGGQQQRVLIARAAAGEPDLLVLDEPNAGVDRRSQDAFARSLRTFVASGRTVLLVLHEMGPLAPLVDRGVILDAGRVVHDGPVPADVHASASGAPDQHQPAGHHPAPVRPERDSAVAGVPDDHPHAAEHEGGPFGWTP